MDLLLIENESSPKSGYKQRKVGHGKLNMAGRTHSEDMQWTSLISPSVMKVSTNIKKSQFVRNPGGGGGGGGGSHIWAI